jgi:hypothetical protein
MVEAVMEDVLSWGVARLFEKMAAVATTLETIRDPKGFVIAVELRVI